MGYRGGAEYTCPAAERGGKGRERVEGGVGGEDRDAGGEK